MARVQVLSSVAVGLEKSFGLLASTPNEAATAVLIPALDSPRLAIQQRAVRAIFERRSPIGQCEVLKRLHIAGDRWRQILEPWRGRMSHVLRDAVLGTDRQQCANGCQAILWLREYDLVPALIAAAENETNPHGRLAARTLLDLVDILGREMSSPDKDHDRLELQNVRQHIAGSLESSVKRFHRHRCAEAVQAFLMVATHDNATLKQVCLDAHHPGHASAVDCLLRSARDGVIRLLLSVLVEPEAPKAVISIISQRGDAKFLREMLAHVHDRRTEAIAENLSRVESAGWLTPDVLDELDDAEQGSLTRWLADCGAQECLVVEALEYLVARGKPAARLAAARMLADVSARATGDCPRTATRPSESAVHSDDNNVQHVGPVETALPRSMEIVDPAHDSVRRAAREHRSALPGDGFWAAVGMLRNATAERRTEFADHRTEEH